MNETRLGKEYGRQPKAWGDLTGFQKRVEWERKSCGGLVAPKVRNGLDTGSACDLGLERNLAG